MTKNYKQKELFDGFIPGPPEINDTDYYSGKEYCMATGVFLDRRLLGVCASHAGKNLRITPKNIKVNTHGFVKTWPLKVWVLAHLVYDRVVREFADSPTLVDEIGGIGEQ